MRSKNRHSLGIQFLVSVVNLSSDDEPEAADNEIHDSQADAVKRNLFGKGEKSF